MNAKPTAQHLDAFVSHTMATLPDSLRLRKVVLVTLISLLPKTYPGRNRILKLIEALRAHENTQLTFRAMFQGDGHNS